jgi:hypothetical protein
MGLSIQSRLERIEASEPVNLIRERRDDRRREVEKFRAFMQPDLDEMMEVAEYCGLPALAELRARIESDWIEQVVLQVAEYKELFWDAERTGERAHEAIVKTDMKFYQEVYGREFSPEDIERAGRLGDRVREDMRAGIPASESEAARAIVEVKVCERSD